MSPDTLPSQFRLARSMSYISDHDGYKLGAVIYRKKKPIGLGYNHNVKTHPLMKRYHVRHSFRIHAELNAILSVRHKHDLTDCTLVVYRETKKGDLALSKPCEECTKIIKSFGIKEIRYTTAEGWSKEKM